MKRLLLATALAVLCVPASADEYDRQTPTPRGPVLVNPGDLRCQECGQVHTRLNGL